MNVKLVKSIYSNGTDKWSRDEDMYCPVCGEKGKIWENVTSTDYYVGGDLICTSCDSGFNYPNGSWKCSGKYYAPTLRGLKGE